MINGRPLLVNCSTANPVTIWHQIHSVNNFQKDIRWIREEDTRFQVDRQLQKQNFYIPMIHPVVQFLKQNQTLPDCFLWCMGFQRKGKPLHLLHKDNVIQRSSNTKVGSKCNSLELCASYCASTLMGDQTFIWPMHRNILSLLVF